MENDGELLRRYVEDGSEAAFSQLVRRHLDFVYGTALRMTRRPHRAEDVTQVVFAALCRKARGLCSRPDLVGWLYVSTHYAAKELVRKEVRREAREAEAAAVLPDPGSLEWGQLAPFADEALHSLRDQDREAILLRFFKNASFAEVGAAIGLSENAARMRVERALDKLRAAFRRHGIISTAAALELALAAQPAAAAPVGLGSSVTAAALANVVHASAGTAAGILAFMSTTKFAFTLAAAAVIGGTLTTLHERRLRAASEGRLAVIIADRDALRSEVARLKKPAPAVPVSTSVLESKLAARTRSVTDAGADAERIAAIAAAAPNTPDGAAAIAKLHVKYDPFLAKRGVSPDQAQRWMELMLAKDQAREDVQAAVREQGIAAGPEVEHLRNEVTQPFWDGMHAILGDDGYQAFNDYERTYGFKQYVVPQLQQVLSVANAPLSDTQSDSLARIISDNQLLTKAHPSDLGSRATTDWAAVLKQSGALLSPQQLVILQSRFETNRMPH